ncbi:MAG: FG-GAP repeat protein [Patescibacteria group bacterium]|jgi:hypothetical protein
MANKKIILFLLVLFFVIPVLGITQEQFDLSELTKILGETADNNTGNPVFSSGDINGDGYDDILISANENDDGGAGAGAVYLIYGQAAEISDLTLSAATAIQFTGEAADDDAGVSISSGDINGDGYDDILIGADFNDGNGLNSGAAYLIYGQAADLADITLSAATTVKFTGEAAADYAGGSVSLDGDVNCDG